VNLNPAPFRRGGKKRAPTNSEAGVLGDSATLCEEGKINAAADYSLTIHQVKREASPILCNHPFWVTAN
jgi:hypothetical protein